MKPWGMLSPPHLDRLSAVVSFVLENKDQANRFLEACKLVGSATMVSAKSIEEFRDTLKNKIMKIPGVKSVVSSIVLSSDKGPRATQKR